MATRSQTKKARKESKTRAAVRKALTPTKKLEARDKAQRERVVKAARAASDKGRPSNPTDPAARLARTAVKQDEAKKLDEKLDRQGRVQAKRTQRIGERRLKTAKKVGKVGAGVTAVGALVGALSKDDKPKPRKVKDMGGKGVLKPTPPAAKKPFRMKGVEEGAKAKVKRDTKRFEEDTKSLGAANIRLNKLEAKRQAEKKQKQGPPQRKPSTKVTPPKMTQEKVKMKVTAPKVNPTVTPKPVPRVVAKAPGLGSRVKTALLGKDQKFGGDRGLIDFLPGKSRKKRSAASTAKSTAKSGTSKAATTSRAKVTGKDKKDGGIRRNVGTGANLRANVTKEQLQRLNLPVNNAGLKKYLDFMDKNNRRPTKADKLTLNKRMGGMAMKSKMASKGGARGGKKMMMPSGMKDGGLAMTTVNGRKVPAFAADGKGPNDLAKKKNGGMMKSKGMAKGGAAMKKKGYAKGGMAKKGYSKGGAVRKSKPRGVGIAKRGYGKAMR
jgi:hypothetical protein